MHPILNALVNLLSVLLGLALVVAYLYFFRRDKLIYSLRGWLKILEAEQIDWEGPGIPMPDLTNLPEVPEADKEEAFQRIMRSTSKALIMHMELLRIPRYMTMRSALQHAGDNQETHYELFFRKLPSKDTPPVALAVLFPEEYARRSEAA